MSGIRFSGLASGLDTESMVKELMKAHQIKVDRVKKRKTKTEWKKDIWKEMNTKLYDFYRKNVFKLKSAGTFMQKKASLSDESCISVQPNSTSVRGTHSIEVNKLAKSAFMNSQIPTVNEDAVVSADTKITVSIGAQDRELELKQGDKINDFVDKLNKLYELSGPDSELPKVKATYENGEVKIINEHTGSESSVKISNLDEHADTFLKQIGVLAKHTTVDKELTFKLSDGTDTKEITLEKGSNLYSFLIKINTLGLDIKANFDEANGIMFINNTKTGSQSNIAFSELDADSEKFLEDIGFSNVDDSNHTLEAGTKGIDAEYTYNGVDLKSASNEVNVNGMTVTLKKTTPKDEPVKVTITQNTDEIYKAVKDFVLKYNEIALDMKEKIDAKSTRGYEPLTKEEKEGMSEDDIKLWEKKIKDSLLRRDDTLRSLSSGMRSILTTSMGVEKTEFDDGYDYLSQIGIVTSKNYKEGGLLHIEGDEDDTEYGMSENKLKKAIEEDPEKVADLLNRIGHKLYEEMQEDMKSTELSSALTFYNDKLMDEKIDDYEDRIDMLQDKLNDMEDRYYKQFTAMEKALQQMNNQGAYLQSMLGGGNQQ